MIYSNVREHHHGRQFRPFVRRIFVLRGIFSVALNKNLSRSSLNSENTEYVLQLINLFYILFNRELEAELLKQEALLNKMHEEMQQSQPVSSTYGTTTPTNVDKEKEEQLWAQQRLVTALKRKVSCVR